MIRLAYYYGVYQGCIMITFTSRAPLDMLHVTVCYMAYQVLVLLGDILTYCTQLQ